ncbi:histidine phosphotransferase [Sphingobium sp. SCG-1]|nr:Hpt domain-containing protein [Sphingobium sp. SCG-1]AUW60457.1 histidine phosphotransferase [Sphingobium sp. SCG-1]
MSHLDAQLIDQTDYAHARSELGAGFMRILGYFREDGTKSVFAIEEAMRAKNAAAMVIPAHTLKGESRQFGAERLGDMAEEIEMVARRCVEHHESPEELIEIVVALRACFAETIAALDKDSNPLVARRPGGFGRKIEPAHGLTRL